jgi:hypothetical protein
MSEDKPVGCQPAQQGTDRKEISKLAHASFINIRKNKDNTNWRG